MSASAGRLRDRLAADPLWRAVRLLDVRWGRTVKAVVLGSLALGSSVALAAVAAWLIARASQMPPVLTLGVAVVSVRAFGISRGIFRYLERLASHDVALRGMAVLRANLYAALAAGRPGTVVALRRGDLLARVGADVDAVGDVVVRALIPAGVAVVVGTGSVVLLTAFLPAAGLALAACLVVAAVVGPWLSARAARTIEVRGAAARADMTSACLDLLENAGPLAVSGRLETRTAALRAADREFAAANDDGARTAGLSAGLVAGATGTAVLAALLLGLPAITAGTLTATELSVVVLTPLAVFEVATVLPAAAVQLRRSRIAAQRIMAMLDGAEPAADDAPVADSAPVGSTVHGGGTAEGTAPVARLDGVACGWGRDPAVTGIDLVLRPGRAVGVVGPSGIGKSTLLMTAAGLVPTQAGTVTLDGVAVDDVPGDELARQVVFVAEDGHVFDTTVLENLRVARGDVTPEEAREALADVGLVGWLDALPDGLGTTLGPDATTVSGGERRRLLVARALLAPAPLLLVDEPAEHLDAATADALVARLVEVCRSRGRGLLLATHRLSALVGVDEVLVLAQPADGGPAAVVARGPHTDLVRDVEAYRWALDREQSGVQVT
ncbi:thiol reductant ABC exporter subunit CydC [Oerskovia flava]|uniref:thiol reductant ABC exporter subunit CydC n=1 Tax=Oerskovia flava TaxID=2986422 RepID=UPI00223F841E|nr:thiol reductant ABC exporter subunit CydC [Oerskovia sp. JB1-3-2]